jgi:hypothetical protein
MTIGKGKRPRDPNQLAKWIVDQSTTEAVPNEPDTSLQARVPTDISEYMAKIGRKGGQIGGKRRLDTMTPAKRKKLARKAAKARWDKSEKQ